MRLALGLILAGVVGAVVALWTWTAPGDLALYPARPGDPGVRIAILDNGFHTDLAMPRRALEAGGGPLAEASRSLGPGDWILIGWGDARFYVDQRPISDRLPDGARAFFRPGNPSVLMLDPVSGDPTRLYPPEGIRTLRLSSTGFDRMRRRIARTLALGPDGQARVAAVRPGDDARFFAAREHFSVLFLCNHWSARVLNAAGLPVRPLRAVTSAEIMAAARRAGAATAELDRTGAGA